MQSSFQWGKGKGEAEQETNVCCKILKLQSCTLGDRSNTFFQSLVGSAENEQHEILSSACT